MWIKEIFLGALGLFFGLSVAGAIFAFVITIGMVPRLAGRTKTASFIMFYENVILVGGITGTVLSLYPVMLPFGNWFLGVYGIFVGMYVGCLAVALAEVLNFFPILFRRTKLRLGIGWVLISVAVGKIAGSLYYYGNHLGK